ncbi:hydrocephalus-inducing protein homolog [Porphyrio hochstetteri]
MATNSVHRPNVVSRRCVQFQSRVVTPPNRKIDHKPKECVTGTPSAFRKTSLTTWQRLSSTQEMRQPPILPPLDTSESCCRKFSAVDVDPSLFQPFPSELVFQNYVPHEVSEAPLVLRNNDNVPRLVKVTLENSPHFKLVRPKCVPYKLAPGLALTYRVIFTPEENKDYSHQITCVTDREQFIVPIRAIGARAILDFPDQLNFSACPVKYSTQKTLLVRNIGNRKACYSISTQSPFSVDHSVGTLGIGDAVQVTVDFHPLKTGDHCGSLLVHYDTGIRVTPQLIFCRWLGEAVTQEQKPGGRLSLSVRAEISQDSAGKLRRRRIQAEPALERECPLRARLRNGLYGCYRLQAEGVGLQDGGGQAGENTNTNLYGAAVNVNIRLEKKSVTFENTYLRQSNRRSVVIQNRSAIIAHFQWKAFGTQEEEDQRERSFAVFELSRVMMAVWFLPRGLDVLHTEPSASPLLELSAAGSSWPGGGSVKGDSSAPARKLCSLPSSGLSALNYGMILASATNALGSSGGGSTGSREDMVVPYTCGSEKEEKRVMLGTCRPGAAALPGEALPWCSSSSSASPKHPSGRESRLPLCIKGEGIGPRLRCSLEQLDIGKVFTGAAHNYKPISLVATGEGPVVYVHPSKIDFGNIQVLEDASRTLYLSNQSVIPASFRAEVAGKHSCCRIEPSKGVIPPETEVAVTVTANLDDIEKFKDEVIVSIENSHSYNVLIQAFGIGTTIVTDKPLAPELNLGPHFSLDRCCYRFNITNKGRRIHRLYWRTEGFPPFPRRDRLPAIQTRGKGSSQNPKPASSVFKLQPLTMELMPGQTMEMTLEGSSSTPQVVKERLLCHAVVGNEVKKRQIMQVDVMCEFIAPVLQVSSRAIAFRVEKQPSDVLSLQYKPLSLKNTSSLPLSIVLMVEQPFQVCSASQQPLPDQPMKLGIGKELNLSIGFNPAYEEGWNSWEAEKALTIHFLEHPHEEQVTIRGEVFFPNLCVQTTTLDFGCVLNDTEHVRYIQMTNCSPLPVQYHWLFLVDDSTSHLRLTPPTLKFFTKAKPPKEEGAQPERPAPAESILRDGSLEELIEALAAMRDSVPQPPDADDTLETEVFSILPLFGVLQPGESERVTVTFFGHPNIMARVTALCRVEGGPTYEVALRGEASLIHYLLDSTEMDCGLQLFTNVTKSEVTLRNSGKVGFTYVVLSPSTATADSPQPGVPLVLPSTGYTAPGREQVLTVYYLPGVPGVFCRTFKIQVGHLEPEEVTLKGEGSFPRIYLDLPRRIKGNQNSEQILKEAKEKLGGDSQRDEAGEATATEPPMDDSGTMLDIGLQMEMENMLLEQHALEQQKALSSFDQRACRRLLKVELPEYVLDFGHVILGDIRTHVVKITNPGQLPASFCASGRALRGTGFIVDLGHVKNLPFCESETFEVRFDPQSANLPVGEVNVVLPIKAEEGPTFPIRLRADVAVPSLRVSRDRLEFAAVHCGQCQEETIQLHSQLQVPCKWFITVKEPVVKVRQGRRVTRNFSVLPSAGTLTPGQRFNVRVRFTPTEEKSYRSKLKINICQSTQHLQLQVSGRGLEPRLEFSPPVLELGPLLPFSPGVGGTVVVKNPCEFPIEFYSLEFDQQYLLEEQVLRVLKDYDCHNTLLLPPRAPGEELPPELLEYYKNQKQLQDEQAKSKTEEQASQDTERQYDTAASKDPPGELDDSPVSRAIARHLGIDTSPEGRAAQNRRGIIVIVHGKTSAAVALSKYYGAACLSIDAVVREAISEGSSWAALQARELCLRAATEQREMEEAGPRADVSLSQQFSTDPKHSMHMSQSSSGTKVRRLPVSSQSRQNRRTERNTSRGQKPHGRDSSSCQGLSSSLSVSPIPCFPPQQWLSPSIVGEVGFMSCVLPEDVLVAILSERLQLSDCFQGVVFDGLETPFACNTVSALLCLLKAIQNRPHIYFVDLYQSADALKARKAAQKEQEERDLEEAAKKEKEWHREMDEEEYEALTEEEKAQFDNYIRQVKREKRKMEQLARELEKKHRQELERLREEELKEKKHGRRELGGDSVSRKKGQPGVRQNTNTSTSKVSDGRQRSVMKGSTKEQPDSVASDMGEKKKRSKSSLRDEGQAVVVQPLDTELGQSKSETLSDSEKNLALRFQIYEALQKDVAHTLAFWDRVQGALHSPPSQEEAEHSIDQRRHLSSCKIRKEREKEQLETLKAPENARLSQPEEESAEGSARSQGVGVPCLDIQVLSPEDVTQKILESGKLPAAEQILDELGLGPSGPPIPPTVFYSVIHYPAKRAVPAAEDDLKHFTFVVPEDATVEEGKTETPMGVLALPTVKTSEEQLTPTRARSRKEKASGSREKRSPGRSRKRVQGSATPTPAHSPKVCQSSVDIVPTPDRPARLSSCRWIVPAHGEVELKIFFTSTELGQFDRTLHFEVLGTNRLFQLHCRGTCLYPTISRDPRVVFPHWRNSKVDDEIIFKQYVMDTGVFHFGPLLCGKSRDWYKALHCPGNCEKITILNVTPLEAEVHFSFEHDIKGKTFLLEPSSMKLKPTEKQELSIWAYPTSAGLKEDNLICRIQGNPEPVVFHLCCQGVQVELGVSPKQVNFSKMLLHRREHRTLVLQNSTPLPMNWQLSGLENLDTDFSVSQDKGTIGPRTESEVHLYLKATKTLSIKKTIQLEVSDAENILGIAQIENIQICAEAHDVGLTINISKGINGGVVFETLRVMDEAKQVLSLKSKGKDPIGYSFSLETADPSTADLASHFTVQPQKGVLAASEHPVQVQLLFHPMTELNIEDKPILLCKVSRLDRAVSTHRVSGVQAGHVSSGRKVFEPNVSGGRTITIIPVRVSAKAVFSKYSIYPASLNFGAVTSGTRKTCTFTLENKGDLDFKFLIRRPEQDPVRRKSAQLPESAHPPENVNVRRTSTSSIRQNRLLLQKDTNPLMQTHLTVGMFTVYPGVGSIPPGGQQVITVDCYARLLGTCKESLSINIKNRDPKDHPSGIPYTLFAESCLPAFVVDDIESIFEEHRICSSINLCHVLQTVKDQGVFIREENKFIFTKVLVGHRATARFKICNVGKVPCDVVFSIKPIPGELDSYVSNIFEVDPVQMCVPSCSHIFATVTFTPQTMQNYQCAFEASLNAQASPAAAEAQSLTFEISGDGNLPQVTVLRPVLQNRRGNPLLLFKKLLLGDLEKLPLVLRNDGIVPVQLMIDLLDEEGVFSLKAKPTTQCIYQAAGMQDSHGKFRKAHTASLVLHHKELAEFDVLFKPNLAQRVEAKIHISLVDNPYREIDIQLVGEGYEDDFILDNIHGLAADSEEEDTKDNLEEDVIEAVRVDHIQFGECRIGTPYPVTFTITNRSKVEAMRFEWLAEPPFHFSPKVGHLHAGCAKVITVTLKSDVAVAFRKHPVKCTVASITFQLPPEHVPDWDDHLHSIKWVDAMKAPGAKWPLKKKVIEMDPEPAHTVLEKSSREVELRLSTVVDYAQFKMDTDTIQFKETLLFQTRTFPFQLSNTGNVALEYTWLEAVEDESEVSCTTSPMEQCLPSLDGDFLSSASGTSVKLQSSHSSPLDHTVEQVSSSSSWSLNTARAPTLPFSIEPKSGTIRAGQEQRFQMKFSPMSVGDFESRMLCRIPNLNPDQKSPEVTVKGRSLMPICHFDLEDSDYITAKRRDPELQGPEEPELDLNRKVIEIAAVGLGSRNRRTITAMNPTSSAYSFQWTCQDPAGPPERVAFFCRTERGHIQPGKKGEITFEFIPRRLGITESFWLFTIPEQSFSVPFLLLGNTTDRLVNLNRAHLNFPSLLIGEHHGYTLRAWTCTSPGAQQSHYSSRLLSPLPLQTNSPDFQSKQTITAAAAGPRGSELSMGVTFEPCQLGETRAVLQLSSPLGGEYCIPLVGLALPPKPQGPFLIEAGSSIAIPFNNIFLQPTAFQYAVEHPAFSVRGPKSVGPKKSSALAVSYEGGAGPGSQPAGGLLPRSSGRAGGAHVLGVLPAGASPLRSDRVSQFCAFSFGTGGAVVIAVTSVPLAPFMVRAQNDKLHEKRKVAALEMQSF